MPEGNGVTTAGNGQDDGGQAGQFCDAQAMSEAVGGLSLRDEGDCTFTYGQDNGPKIRAPIRQGVFATLDRGDQNILIIGDGRCYEFTAGTFRSGDYAFNNNPNAFYAFEAEYARKQGLPRFFTGNFSVSGAQRLTEDPASGTECTWATRVS
jgi:hypothetical protein